MLGITGVGVQGLHFSGMRIKECVCQGYQLKGSRLKDGFIIDERLGSCDCDLDWFYMYGGQSRMGFHNFRSSMLVR